MSSLFRNREHVLQIINPERRLIVIKHVMGSFDEIREMA